MRSCSCKARRTASVNASLPALVSFRKVVSWKVDPMETVCVPNKGAGTHCALSESWVRTATQRVSCESGALALGLGSESCRESPFRIRRREVISSSVGLVPRNTLVFIDSCKLVRVPVRCRSLDQSTMTRYFRSAEGNSVQLRARFQERGPARRQGWKLLERSLNWCTLGAL